MKIAVYEAKPYEEPALTYCKESYHLDLVCINEILTHENIHHTKGCDGISTLGQGSCNASIIDALCENGIKALSTRTIGSDHIDVSYAKSKGLRVGHGYYEPTGVADYTIMLMLMCLRRYKQTLYRGNINDFSLVGLQGGELHNQIVGIVGTGKIGKTVIEYLSGFGCTILAYDTFEDPSLKDRVQYVDLNTLYAKSDIISLHTPLLAETEHMICKESIAKMKDGVILINCARGELICTDDLIEAVEHQKFGAIGLDVLEYERGIYHIDHRLDVLGNRNMAYLRQFPHVITTPHMAFFTKEAIQSMVEASLQSLTAFLSGGTSPFEL